VTTVGWSDPRFLRYLGSVARGIPREAFSGLSAIGDPSRSRPAAMLRALGGGLVRAAVDAAGTLAGLAGAIRPVDRAQSIPPLVADDPRAR
jgi:hypothetical protein